MVWSRHQASQASKEVFAAEFTSVAEWLLFDRYGIWKMMIDAAQRWYSRGISANSHLPVGRFCRFTFLAVVESPEFPAAALTILTPDTDNTEARQDGPKSDHKHNEDRRRNSGWLGIANMSA